MSFPLLFRINHKYKYIYIGFCVLALMGALALSAHATEPVRIGLTEIEGLAKTMILNQNQVQKVQLEVKNFSNQHDALWPRIVVTAPSGAVLF